MEKMAQEKEENQLVEHEVQVNDFVSVKLKIPKKLDALELKSLATMSTKLLNMTEIKTSRSLPSNQSRRKPVMGIMSKDEKKTLVRRFYSLKTEDEKVKMAEDYKMSLAELKRKVYNAKFYLKQRGIVV